MQGFGSRHDTLVAESLVLVPAKNADSHLYTEFNLKSELVVNEDFAFHLENIIPTLLNNALVDRTVNSAEFQEDFPSLQQ